MRRSISHLLKSANSVRQATGILVVTALLSNVLGLVRNTIIARNIPLGIQDNFWSAFLLPDIVFNVLIFGAISSAFIPLFRGLLVEKKDDEAWQLAGSFFGQLSVLVAILAVVMGIFMPNLVHLIFPHINGGDTGSVIILSRLLLIQTIFMCWSYLAGGILNAQKRFVAYSLSPLVYNLSIIVGAVIAPRFGASAITVLIWSVVVGAVLHLAIQLPSVISVGWRFKYTSLRPTSLTNEIFRLMTPRSISLGIMSLSNLLLAAIARAMLLPGALSITQLVQAFQTAPIAIFGNAIAVAIFPTLTEYATQKDWQQFGQAVEKAFRFILYTIIPSTVIFIVLRAQIIRLYIGLGSSISWADTMRAIDMFGWFAMGMVPAGLVSVLARSFYAFKNTLWPLAAAGASLVFQVAIAYSLARHTNLDVSGLGIANTAAALIQFIFLYIAYLRFARKPMNERPILLTGLWTTIASIAMAATTWFSLRIVDYLYESWSITRLDTHYVVGLGLQSLIALLAGFGVFLLIARRTMPEEWDWLSKYLTKRRATETV